MWYRVLLVLGLISYLTPALAANPTITVSTNNTPLDRKVLLAVSKESFRRVGVDFNLVSLPSARSLRSADMGKVDGEGLRIGGLSAKYPNLIQIPEPYVRISFVAFGKDRTIKIDGWESLKSYRVAFINGWKMFEKHAVVAKSVTKVDTPEQLFRMLERGRVDLALYTEADGIDLVRRLQLPAVAPLDAALKEVDLFLYLNRRHEALVPKVTAAIRDMKEDGTYKEILSAIISP